MPLPILLIERTYNSCDEEMVQEIFSLIFGNVVKRVTIIPNGQQRKIFIHLHETDNTLLNDFIAYIKSYGYKNIEYQLDTFWAIEIYEKGFVPRIVEDPEYTSRLDFIVRSKHYANAFTPYFPGAEKLCIDPNFDPNFEYVCECEEKRKFHDN